MFGIGLKALDSALGQKLLSPFQKNLAEQTLTS